MCKASCCQGIGKTLGFEAFNGSKLKMMIELIANQQIP